MQYLDWPDNEAPNQDKTFDDLEIILKEMFK
jgi:hypothetical protein